MKAILVAWALLVAAPAYADIRSNLVTRLNELMDDASNRKMSSANKILFLNGMGREYGRRGLYVKRDTVITVANTDNYALNADFAGALQGVYRRRGQERIILPVIDRDSAFKAPEVTPGVISYLFVEEDGTLGVQAVPLRADTLILLYYALPAVLASDSTEWALPDYYEEPALYETAASCLLKVGTAESQAKASALLQIGMAKLAELRSPPGQVRQIKDQKP